MQNIELEWKGQTYTVPASKAFELGERIEDIVSRGEIPNWVSSPKFHKMARCHGEMLRFAGANVTNQEVFSEMMSQIKGGTQEALVAAQAMEALILVLMDGAPDGGGGDEGKKTNAL